jgi:hypothetical protein
MERTLTLHRGIHQSIFMPAVQSPPDKDLPFCWDQHSSKLLPGIAEYRSDAISQWTCEQVSEFASQLPGCKNVAKVFMREVNRLRLCGTRS